VVRKWCGVRGGSECWDAVMMRTCTGRGMTALADEQEGAGGGWE